jgi:hypothetical protein
LRAAEDRVVNVNMNQQNMVKTFDEQETIQEKEFYYEVDKSIELNEVILIKLEVINFFFNFILLIDKTKFQ